jgi:hypothetical protein
MSPSNKFHLFVATTTIAVMYWIINHLSPLLQSTAHLNLYYRVAIVYLGSAAFYQLLASGLRWLFEYWRHLRRWVLGPEYIEGTWIGCYKNPAGQKQFTIEHFEQTLDRIVIRGYAYLENGTLHAQWNSKAVAVNADQGTLTYSYDCDVHANKSSFQGLAAFTFERKGPRKAPTAMCGYSADLIDGVRSTNQEIKLSDSQVDVGKALAEAKRKF